MKKKVDDNKPFDQSKDTSTKNKKVLDLNQFNKKKPAHREVDSDVYDDNYIDSQNDCFDEYNWWSA